MVNRATIAKVRADPGGGEHSGPAAFPEKPSGKANTAAEAAPAALCGLKTARPAVPGLLAPVKMAAEAPLRGLAGFKMAAEAVPRVL